MNLCEFKVDTTYTVDVMQVNSPHSIYVRTPDISEFIEAVEKPGNPLTANIIRYGQRVIFKSNVLGKHVRGEIRFMNVVGQKAEFDIFAIDYGYYEKSISLDCIYSLNREAEPLNQQPSLAVYCRLYLCEPLDKEFSEKVIDCTKDYCSEQTAQITVKGKLHDQLVVALYTDKCPMDVSSMLNLMDLTYCMRECSINNVMDTYSSTTMDPTSSALTSTLNYAHRKLKVGDTLHVTVQHGTSASGFYVAEVDEYEKLNNTRKNLTLFQKDKISKMRDEDIIPGIPCVAKVNATEMYERAIVKEILNPNTTAVLTLVDYGKEIEMNFSDIRSVASEIFYEQPIIAIYCSTDKHKVWNNLPKYLFPGYQVMIKIREVGNGFIQPHKVDIYQLKL